MIAVQKNSHSLPLIEEDMQGAFPGEIIPVHVA
jgi:hypothetical protein